MSVGRYLAIIALAASTLIGVGEAEARREPVAALPAIAAVDLPKEARMTLALIRDNGPFPYERDGVSLRQSRGYVAAEATRLLSRIHGQDAGSEQPRRAAHRLRLARPRPLRNAITPTTTINRSGAYAHEAALISAVFDDAGVHDWAGEPDTVKAAAGAAKLGFHSVDAGRADSKSALIAALAEGLSCRNISATTGTRSPIVSRMATGSAVTAW